MWLQAEPQEAQSWALMFDKRLQDKIFVKDAFRDVYSPMLLYAKTLEARAAGTLGPEEMLSLDTIHELMYDSSDASIALVERYLKQMKELVAGWEADFGKEMMTQEKAWINLMWSGDAVWAIEEASYVDVDLGYAVPREGSVVWFDGWVIPKYARNVKAASYFINFMCMQESALRNMDMTGYVSVIGGDAILESISDEEEYDATDASYFFGEDADSVHVNSIMYPDKAVVDRCAMMHDTDTEALLKMWSRVKGDSASAWTYILICLVFCGLITAVIIKYTRKRIRRKRYARKRRR